jgi:Domain of unknown function (DUF1814).
VTALTLPERILALERGLAAIPHAFGGALALAYYAEPRATIDIDLNLFVPADRFPDVAAPLLALGVDADDPDAVAAVARDGQTRVMWGRTPIDLFFAYDAFHDHAAERVRSVPFGNATIPILAPEDLLVCKTVFDRRKDWIDIDQILALTAGDLDIDDVRRWVTRIVGADDPRYAKLNAAIAEILDK